MGGVTPLGYEVRNRRLVIVPEEAETVRLIYARYQELGSVRLLQQHLDTAGIRSKVRTYRDGRAAGGRPFSRGALYALLSNPIYIGEIAHKGVRHAGLQEPILERPLWAAVQHQLRDQVRRCRPGKGVRSPLLGKIFDQTGNRLTPSHAVKNGRRYRYYVSRGLVVGTSQEDPDGWRLPAPQIERLVADEAIRGLADRKAVTAALEKAKVPTGQFPSALAAAERWCRRLRSDTDRNDALVRLVDRVELGRGRFRVSVNLGPLLEGGHREIALAREATLAIKRRGVEMRLVLDSGPPTASRSVSAPPARLHQQISAG